MATINRRQFVATVGSLSAAAWVGLPASGAASGGRIKIGQIGTTHAHAAGKMQAMRSASDVYEVVGIVEADPQRRAAMASNKTYEGLRWLEEEQLLNTPGLAAVAVETEVRDLVPTAMRCIQAGKHIHLDKPAGESLSAYKALRDESTRRALTVQMGYMLRYNVAFEFMYRAVHDGWLGDVFSIHAEMSKIVNDASRRTLAQYTGGSMFELGCHVIDSVVYLLGKPASVSAHGLRTRPKDDALVDHQVAVLDYPAANAVVRSAVCELNGQSRRQFVVMGSEGQIEIQPLESGRFTLTLTKARGPFKKGRQEVQLEKSGGRYDGEFADLASVIRGEKEFAWSAAHDLAAHETILRASGVQID